MQDKKIDNQENMKVLQMSALSRINFVYENLKNNPPMQMILPIDTKDSNQIKEYLYLSKYLLPYEEQKKIFLYLQNESLTESKVMLIINYLYALLIKGNNNKISIHKNFCNKVEEIKNFEENNKDILDKIKIVRDKFYSHIDLDFPQYLEKISFKEIEICVDFLNKLFNYNFEKLKNYFK